MISTYNAGMKGTDLMDQKTQPYAFDRKDPLKYYTKPFYDYLDMAVVNSFVIQEALASQRDAVKKHDPHMDAGINRPKTLLDFKRKLAAGLIGSHTSRTYPARAATQPQASTSGFHEVVMEATRGRCNWCYQTEKADRKTSFKCTTCSVFLCLTKNRNCVNAKHASV